MNSLPDLNLTPTMDDSQAPPLHDSTTNRIKDGSMALDRLSELPDALLHEILSLLPMREVSATMILAKRCKNVWTTVPCLHFQFNKKKKEDSYNFPDFVQGALARWKGEKILKFGIELHDCEYDHGAVNSWLLFAVDKRVEELYVKFFYDEYHLPDAVYSCSSITKLSLTAVVLVVKESVRWNQLNSLTLDAAFNFHEDVLNQILLCAPLLEVFNLRTEPIFGDLDIRSTRLKSLNIYYYDIGAYDEDEAPTVARISAPILENLEFAGIRYTPCLLKFLSLTNANLDFDVILKVVLPWNFEVGEMFREAVLGISHAVKLTSNKWSLTLLVDKMTDDTLEPFSNETQVAAFSNAKFLKLCAVNAEGMLNVLGMFPELEMLIVERMENGEFNPMLCDLTFPQSSLLHLKTVEITWCIHNDDSIIPVIKTLLKDAPVLEKMVVRLGMHGAVLDLSDLRHVDIFL